MMNDTQKMRTWAEIDLSHLEHNYRALRSLLPSGCRLAGMVKANAYGHGAVSVAKKLESLGSEYMLVACLDEAIELRQGGVKAPIMILSPTSERFISELLQYHITQTVTDLASAKKLSKAAADRNQRLKIHIKVDTGMSRLGMLCQESSIEEAAREILEIYDLPGLDTEGIYTHFSNADGDEAYTMMQLSRFLDLKKLVDRPGLIWHCASSAATLQYPCAYMDMVRPGISLYGHYPSPELEDLDGVGLLPVMTLKSRIISLKDFPPGTLVSYGGTYVLQRDSKIAVLPIGYGDGLSRLLSNNCQVLIHDKRVDVVGRICMDMCMVDVTDLPSVEVGDVAVVFGPELPVEEKADAIGTIQYELLTGIAPRVPRVFIDS